MKHPSLTTLFALADVQSVASYDTSNNKAIHTRFFLKIENLFCVKVDFKFAVVDINFKYKSHFMSCLGSTPGLHVVQLSVDGLHYDRQVG